MAQDEDYFAKKLQETLKHHGQVNEEVDEKEERHEEKRHEEGDEKEVNDYVSGEHTLAHLGAVSSDSLNTQKCVNDPKHASTRGQRSPMTKLSFCAGKCVQQIAYLIS